MFRPLILSCILPCVVFACGDEVTVGDPGSTGAGASGGTATATTGSTATTGGGGTCAAYADEESTYQLTLRFVSQSTRDIYIPATCGHLRHEATLVGSQDEVRWAYTDDCLQTCEDLQTESVILCEPCAPSAYLLPAGGTLEVPWPGDGLVAHEGVPDACFFDPQTNGYCNQKVAAPLGTWRFYAEGFADCDGCTCDPSTGLCEGEPSGQQAFSQADMVEITGDATVDVVFGGCAFPCP